MTALYDTANDFVKSEIDAWGFDYVESLFDKGYEPQHLVDSNGKEKWVWVLTSRVVSKHN